MVRLWAEEEGDHETTPVHCERFTENEPEFKPQLWVAPPPDGAMAYQQLYGLSEQERYEVTVLIMEIAWSRG